MKKLLLWFLVDCILEAKCFEFESFNFRRDASADSILNGTHSIETDEGTIEEVHDIDKAFFGSLQNFQVNAKPQFDKSLYIAKVIHSRTQAYPFVCTCTCVEERIFVTAARCIRSLKVKHSSVFYLEKYLLKVQAFVIPSKPSKQFFEDIGIIVVEDPQYIRKWLQKDMDAPVNFTKNYTAWEIDIKAKLWKYGATPAFGLLGFAAEKHMYKAKDHRVEYKRYFAQDLYMSTDFCFEMLGKKQIDAYRVPCLMPCTLTELKKGADVCKTQLAAEGGLVYGYIAGESWSFNLGVATWGVSSVEEYAMPIGFAVINSRKFRVDYHCALKIRNDKLTPVPQGYYQHLCNNSDVSE